MGEESNEESDAVPLGGRRSSQAAPSSKFHDVGKVEFSRIATERAVRLYGGIFALETHFLNGVLAKELSGDCNSKCLSLLSFIRWG